jgi:hypothetical protein
MKTKLRPLTLLTLLLLVVQHASAQTQVLRGVVKDSDTQEPLFGVSLAITGIEPVLTATTDDQGRFRFAAVPVGRQVLTLSMVGYKTLAVPNVLVTAGKEVVLELGLVASVSALREAVVTRDSGKDRPQNELAKVSARTFSLEEVTRYSGGRNDVARLATNFAGVTAANDSRNDIVVRGNSPTGLLWRVEGLPVPTTNHFATLGTTGGPVSALNTNLLRTSDFLTGAFPAEYGNANAAVFDVRFRSGNNERHEFTGQMSAFSGAELVAEGPLSRGKGSSYLVAGRYGIAGVAATGTSATPYYQDIAFKLDLGRSKLGRFEVFGMGGNSSIDFLGAELDSTDLFADPSVDSYFTSRMAMGGVNHFLQLTGRSYLRTTVGTTYLRTRFDQDNYTEATTDRPTAKFRATEAEDREQRYTVSTQYNNKLSPRFNLRTGTVVELYDILSSVRDRDDRTELPDADVDGIPDRFVQVRDVDGSTVLAQLYAQGEFKVSDVLTLTGGLHGQYLQETGDAMVGPRAGMSWQFRPDQRISFGYGLHGQQVPLPILFYQQEVSPGVYERTNAGLDFQKSHHFVFAYDRRFGPDWRVKAEVYHQELFDLGVEGGSSSYSTVNEGADFVFTERGSLRSAGKGSNQGVELTVEKFLSRGYYMLTTASVFSSRYAGSDGVDRNTGFDSRYVFNTLVGREWLVGSAKRNAITFDTKFTTSGGRPYSPIDLEATRANGGREVYVDAEAYSLRYDAYLRLDVKVGMRLNSKSGRVSHQFFVDLQNVTDRENIFVERYNPVTDRINPVYQNGFFPDFMYRIQF